MNAFLHHYDRIINSIFTAQKSLSLDFLVEPFEWNLEISAIVFAKHMPLWIFFCARFITGGVYALLTGDF